MRGDLAGERHNLIHGRADDDQLGFTHRIDCGICDVIAPWLIFELQSGFRSTRPERDAFRHAIMPSGPGDGGTEQTGSKNGDLIKHDPSEKTPQGIVEPR